MLMACYGLVQGNDLVIYTYEIHQIHVTDYLVNAYNYRCYYPVKKYRRDIADFFGVILLKRRRIAGEVSTLWA